MAVSKHELPDDVELLKKHAIELATERDDLATERDDLATERDGLAARNAFLENKIAELLRRRVSQCTHDDGHEQEVDGAQHLFDFVHEFADEAAEQLGETIDPEPGGDGEDGDSTKAAKRVGKSKRKPGRRPLPEDLLRIQTVYDVEENQRQCSCGKAMPEIGEETSEELVRLEMLFVHQHVRKKYACNSCDDGVIVAPAPERVLPKSMAGPSLLAWLINAKFGDHLPYYRLEGILAREGAPVRRATLCNWVSRCSDLLKPIADEVLRQIVTDNYVQTDDTSKLMQRGNEGTSRYGHVWVYTTPEGKVYFDFTATRERHGPNRILENFEGVVQADAYSGYDELFRGGKAREAACWAHTKRKFDDAKETDPENAGKALGAIRKLYEIEREAKVRKLAHDERKDLRQERAPPILEALKKWLEPERVRVLPKSPIAVAIGYTLNQWDALNTYLEDGRIEIDNNRAERMLRSVAVGRKNDLFECQSYSIVK